MSAKVYTIQVQEEGDDVIIEFPEEIIESTGWQVGDD